MVEPTPKDKYIYYPNGRSADDFKNSVVEAEHKASLDNRAEYFKKEAESVHWHKKFTQVLDTSDKYLHRWFPDGEINICYNAVDRHVASGNGDDIAFLEDSVYTGKQ
jgi:propionyl-CoA synthetase